MLNSIWSFCALRMQAGTPTETLFLSVRICIHLWLSPSVSLRDAYNAHIVVQFAHATWLEDSPHLQPRILTHCWAFIGMECELREDAVVHRYRRLITLSADALKAKNGFAVPGVRRSVHRFRQFYLLISQNVEQVVRRPGPLRSIERPEVIADIQSDSGADVLDNKLRIAATDDHYANCVVHLQNGVRGVPQIRPKGQARFCHALDLFHRGHPQFHRFNCIPDQYGQRGEPNEKISERDVFGHG